MSVNVGQRNVADTPANNQCYAVDMALSLCVHTIRICSNTNIFTTEFKAITDRIIGIATDIYMNAYSANKIYVASNEDWMAREEREIASFRLCNDLIGYIGIAKRLFHLRKGKVENWVKMTLETRGMINKWYTSDRNRYTK